MRVNPYERLVQQKMKWRGRESPAAVNFSKYTSNYYSNILNISLPKDISIKLKLAGESFNFGYSGLLIISLCSLILSVFISKIDGLKYNTPLLYLFVSLCLVSFGCFFIFLLILFVSAIGHILNQPFKMKGSDSTINIVAVKITNINTISNDVYYFFEGALIANFRIGTRSGRWGSRVGRLNFSKFKKNAHTILWLDQQQKIAMAAERGLSDGGGAVLLDKDLHHLKLSSEQDKRRLLALLQEEQAKIMASPALLDKISNGIKIAEENSRFIREEELRIRRGNAASSSGTTIYSGSGSGGGGGSDYSSGGSDYGSYDGGGDCGGRGGDGGGGGGE